MTEEEIKNLSLFKKVDECFKQYKQISLISYDLRNFISNLFIDLEKSGYDNKKIAEYKEQLKSIYEVKKNGK